jgi:serine/threonine protein kinase
MNSELQEIAQKLSQAQCPEDVFGEIEGCLKDKLASLKTSYHRLARITHPDLYRTREDQRAALAAFQNLTAWFSSAETKLKAGLYGQNPDSARIRIDTRKRSYHLNGRYTESLIYNHYPCTFDEDGQTNQAIIKVARDPQDNDLAQNEAALLDALKTGKASKKFAPYLPQMIDSFLYQEGSLSRQANVFTYQPGWYSLEEVRQAYPDGLDPKDMAWIWRRLLVALGFIHLNGVIHGAVLPGNIWILPEEHGLRLQEFSFAVGDLEMPGCSIAVIDPAYEGWYPNEVHKKQAPAPGTDIGMAARCMIELLAGDPLRGTYPERIPPFIRSFFKGCTLPGKNARPQDAWALKEEFDVLLNKHWGERKFHPFTMKNNP